MDNQEFLYANSNSPTTEDFLNSFNPEGNWNFHVLQNTALNCFELHDLSITDDAYSVSSPESVRDLTLPKFGEAKESSTKHEKFNQHANASIAICLDSSETKQTSGEGNALNMTECEPSTSQTKKNSRKRKQAKNERNEQGKIFEQEKEEDRKEQDKIDSLERENASLMEEKDNLKRQLENCLTQNTNKRKRCSMCPSKLDRKSKMQCNKCHQSICGEHSVKICLKCNE